MIDVMEELKLAGQFFRDAQFTEGLSAVRELWGQLPNPRSSIPNAYLVASYGAALAMKCGDLAEAKMWAERGLEFAAARGDIGEAEFLVGKVEFESGRLDEAKAAFLIADRKSRGRAFVGQDPRYRALLGKKTK
jgi:tetratricopeptide (TPR) repeat protein